MALKLLELTRFLSPYLLSIYQLLTLILYGVGVRCDRWRFFVLNPLIEESMVIQSWSIVLLCRGQLLNVIFNFSSARYIRWSGFVLIHSFLSLCHRRHVNLLCMLYEAYSSSDHCLFSESPAASTRVRHIRMLLQFVHFSLKCQGVECSNLHGVSCRSRFLFGMDFPTLCLAP